MLLFMRERWRGMTDRHFWCCVTRMALSVKGTACVCWGEGEEGGRYYRRLVYYVFVHMPLLTVTMTTMFCSSLGVDLKTTWLVNTRHSETVPFLCIIKHPSLWPILPVIVMQNWSLPLKKRERKKKGSVVWVESLLLYYVVVVLSAIFVVVVAFFQ